jgi:formiminoglutamate deiminase
VTTYWCEWAWLGDAEAPAVPGATITVEDDRIVWVEAGAASPPPDAVALRGLTVPGLANAHSHAFQRALRGRTQGEVGSFWSWRDRMYDLAARLDPDTYRALATATFAEMALAGFTCVGEFHYLHHDPAGRPYADPNAMGRALVDAAGAAGVRLTLLDTCYLQAGPGTAPGPVQRRFADAGVGAWAGRASALAEEQSTGRAVRIGAAVHSVRAVDPSSIEVVAAWAGARRTPLHAHVSEQPRENDECVAAHGMTPVNLFERHGALGERFTAVHATHVTAEDVARLAASGSSVCLCPTTERDLADGVAPTGAFRASGVPMCVGTDSHALIDGFEEARAVELDERLVARRRGTHTPGELLAMATASGYRSLGWPDGGRIEPGALADLTSVRLDSVRLAGADPAAAIASVVFGSAAADVHHVVVGGDVVVAGGQHRRIDVAAALEAAIAPVWA